MNRSIIYKAKENKDIQEDLRKLEALQKELKALEQDPCEDCISRQAVIDILDDMTKDYAKNNDFEKVNGVAWVKVQKLPSVNPQKPVLDKIRAEIMSKDGLEEALEIIDKYKAESEEEE